MSQPHRPLFALLTVLAGFGCGVDADPIQIVLDDPDTSAESTPDMSETSTSPEPDMAISEPDTDGPDLGAPDPDVVPTEVGLSIEFDYRFDTAGFFDSPESRGVLEEAARRWGVWLQDDFDTIVAGTPIYTRDPEDPSLEPFINIEDDIDDLLVFVGSAARDGSYAGSSATAAFPAESDDPELRAALYERWESTTNYEPWTGWASFDDDRDWFFDPTPATDDDVPAGSVDAMSIAMHELGHILGVSPSEAFSVHVVDGTFQGPRAMEVYGGPVPLAGDGFGHIADEVRIDGKRPLMSTRKPADARYEITRLDRAILADIGYELP